MKHSSQGLTQSRPQRIGRFGLWFLMIPAALLGLSAVRGQDNVRIQRDVIYGQASGQNLLLDVFQAPRAKKPRPAVVLVHGGAWREGDKSEFNDLGRILAASGYNCFSVNYRLVRSGANLHPAQLDDVQRAIRWVRSRAAIYNIDPKRVAALGDSAGGHLVALLGTRDTRDNRDPRLARFSSRPTCVVDLFGPTDFTASFTPRTQRESEGRKMVTDFLGREPKAAPKLYRDASPIFGIDRKTVPFLIFHGTLDTLVPLDQSQRLHRALLKNGTPSQLVIFPDEGHGFRKPENQKVAVSRTLAFLKKYMPGPR